MLYKSINSAAFPYTYQSHVYLRKPEGTPNEFYIFGTENYIQYLVTKWGYYDIRGWHITKDRLCSSLSIANWFLKHRITMVRTRMLNRVGIPMEIKEVTNRKVFSTEIYWQEKSKRNLTFYVVSSSKTKRKNIIVLTTIDRLLGVAIYDDINMNVNKKNM